MKKIISVVVLLSTLSFSSVAMATTYSEWYGKEGQDETPVYMERALAKLPTDKAENFRETMQDSQEDNKNLQEQVYKLHSDLHAILTAPTFDKDAFISKRDQIQRLRDKIESNRTDAFASAVSDLSQDERIILTRALHKSKMNKQKMVQTPNGNPAPSRNASILH